MSSMNQKNLLKINNNHFFQRKRNRIFHQKIHFTKSAIKISFLYFSFILLVYLGQKYI